MCNFLQKKKRSKALIIIIRVIMKFSYWIFLHAHRVSLFALTSPPLAKQLLIVLFGRVENPRLGLFGYA